MLIRPALFVFYAYFDTLQNTGMLEGTKSFSDVLYALGSMNWPHITDGTES